METVFLLASLPLSFVAWIYWLFCVHRLHEIVVRATDGGYPIRPRRAVLLQLVPVYSWVWRFRWSSQMAEFINLYSSTAVRTDLPAFLLILASIMGDGALFVACTSLRLILLFGVASYFTHKIKKIVPFNDCLRLARRKQLDLALTSGLGAALGFVFVRALPGFCARGAKDILLDGLGILLLSVMFAKIIEPARERVISAIDCDAPHPLYHHSRPWITRAAVFLALVCSNFVHDLLHEQLNFGPHDPVSPVPDAVVNWPVFLVGLTVSGGITYFWISGMRQEPRRAARFGALSGAGIALLVGFIIGIIVDPPKKDVTLDASPTALKQVIPQAHVPEMHLPVVPFGTISSAGTNALPWALLGLVGGLVIDRKWGGPGVRRIVLGILGSALLFGITWLFWDHGGTYGEQIMKLMADLTAVGGWCLGLMLHPATSTVFGSEETILA